MIIFEGEKEKEEVWLFVICKVISSVPTHCHVVSISPVSPTLSVPTCITFRC